MSIEDFLNGMEKSLEGIELEMSWVEISGQWEDTFDSFERMTGLLEKSQKIHETWLESLDKV